MVSLNLGVIEVPYDNGGKRPVRKVPKKPRKGNKPPPTTRSATVEPTDTVQVARILEEKYGVMAVFYDQMKDDIEGAVIHSMEGALENLFAGEPVGNPYADADQEIGAAFRQFLQQGEIERLGIEGVPTQASLDRKSARFKSGKSSAQRPSFIDTGTYELAFRAWFDQ